MEKRAILAELLVLTLALPLSGSLLTDGGSMVEANSTPISLDQNELTPVRTPVTPSDNQWWERTSLDSNRNGIHDSLESDDPLQWVGLSYSRDIGSSDLLSLMSLGLAPRVHVPAVNALLLGQVETDLLYQLSGLEGVVMVEEYEGWSSSATYRPLDQGQPIGHLPSRRMGSRRHRQWSEYRPDRHRS